MMNAGHRLVATSLSANVAPGFCVREEMNGRRKMSLLTLAHCQLFPFVGAGPCL